MKTELTFATRRVRTALLVAAVVAAFSGARSAHAVTGGTVGKDNRYPNSGAIVGVVPGAAFEFCSGALIHPRVLLTAGHCTAQLEAFLNAGVITTDNIRVSFGIQALDPDTWLEIESVVTHPDFDIDARPSNRDLSDVGVIILKEPVLDITPAILPTVGFLDELKKNEQLLKKELTLVGYGAQLSFPPPEVIPPDGLRRFSFPDYRGLNKAWITIGLNEPGGEIDGGCFGDSGAPLLWEYDGMQVVVGIISWGNKNCVGAGHAYRADTLQTLDFVDVILEFVSMD